MVGYWLFSVLIDYILVLVINDVSMVGQDDNIDSSDVTYRLIKIKLQTTSSAI